MLPIFRPVGATILYKLPERKSTVKRHQDRHLRTAFRNAAGATLDMVVTAVAPSLALWKSDQFS